MEGFPDDGRVKINSEAGMDVIQDGKGIQGRDEVKDGIDHSPDGKQLDLTAVEIEGSRAGGEGRGGG